MIALNGRGGRLRLWTAVGLLLAAGSAPAVANDVPALLVEKRCNACHDTNAMLIGPAYVAIAARHRENKDTMVEVLARKIVMGGGGTWGLVPMVPNEHVSMEEARAMAKWILEVAPPS